jgi:hypothetical protein
MGLADRRRTRGQVAPQDRRRPGTTYAAAAAGDRDGESGTATRKSGGAGSHNGL